MDDVDDDRTKLLISDARNHLRPDIIEASECYISWAKAELMDDTIILLDL